MQLAMQRDELIFAVTDVVASAVACADHGDENTFETLTRYYRTVAEEITAARGRVVKTMGDGVLMTFPVNDPAFAVQTLRTMQAKCNALWQQFDKRCEVQVKVGIGAVVCGKLGAPGSEQFDIVGSALNALFKAPWGRFVILSELEKRI